MEAKRAFIGLEPMEKPNVKIAVELRMTIGAITKMYMKLVNQKYIVKYQNSGNNKEEMDYEILLEYING